MMLTFNKSDLYRFWWCSVIVIICFLQLGNKIYIVIGYDWPWPIVFRLTFVQSSLLSRIKIGFIELFGSNFFLQNQLHLSEKKLYYKTNILSNTKITKFKHIAHVLNAALIILFFFSSNQKNNLQNTIREWNKGVQIMTQVNAIENDHLNRSSLS